MNKKRIQLIDEVLAYLGTDTTWGSLRQKFPENIVDREKMKGILIKLENDGYMERYDGTVRLTSHVGYVNSTRIVRTEEGNLFVDRDGYAGQFVRQKRNSFFAGSINWIQAIIAACTLFLGIMSYRQANKISDLEKENEILKGKIQLLQLKK